MLYLCEYFFLFHQKPIRQDSTNRVSVITIIRSANGLTTLGNSVYKLVFYFFYQKVIRRDSRNGVYVTIYILLMVDQGDAPHWLEYKHAM